jgi:hypothetical protein
MENQTTPENPKLKSILGESIDSCYADNELDWFRFENK